MLGNDGQMQIVAYMLDRGFSFEYIFSLNTYEQLLVLGAIDANRELEDRKWQLEKKSPL